MAGSALTTRPLYRAAYRFWFPTATIFLINGVAFGGWAALIPRATTRLQVDEGTFGLMLLAMGIGAVLAMAFSGRLIAKFGAATLIRLSLAVFLASYIVLSVSSNQGVFVAALLLFGGAGGLMDVAMNAYAADVEAHMDWRVMASFHGMWSVGGLVGAAAVATMLALVSDLSQALVLDGCLILIFFTCQHLLVPLRHHESGKASRNFSINRVSLILAILAAICFSAEGAVRDWSSLYLTNEIQTSIDRAGWAYAAFSAAMAFCRLSGDWLRLRFGEQRVIIASCAAAILGYVMAVLLDQHLLIVAGFALVGVGLSNIVPILISAAGRGDAPGSVIAFVVTFGYAGFLASPPILGFIASQSSLATMFLFVMASCFLIPAGWRMIERR
jgi:MFS family permease